MRPWPRRVLLASAVAGAAGAYWYFGRWRVHLRLTQRGLHEGTTPIDLMEAVRRTRAHGGVAVLVVDADAYEADFVAIRNLFRLEKLTLNARLPKTPLLPYSTPAREMR